jgi:hypothetical protein
MREQLRKFIVGDLATVVRSSYAVGLNIAGLSALVVEVQRYSGKALDDGPSRAQHRVLIDNELYDLYETELQ